MANPLAKQMLDNLARKAGQQVGMTNESVEKPLKTKVHLNAEEERLIVDLIHLRNTLYPSKKTNVASKKTIHQQSPQQGMISLSDLAKKKS